METKVIRITDPETSAEELKEAARDAQTLDSNLYQTIKSIITENESETDE